MSIKPMTLIAKSSKTVKVTVKDMPAATSVETAYLMVKPTPESVDADAVITKTITATATSSGQVTDDGDPSGKAQLSFVITTSDSDLPPKTYYMAVKVILSSGAAVELPESRRPVSLLNAQVERTS
ncbi:MAG: hypothetical protein BGO01_03605 [Armatimonadetes bacterium 55-13]|nr:hypothetical protein [Armatimonadota bacterium]OJU63033.1 MAG: hypothetical protein BGO01_03605 [Armatimonadetes bacterium 55-13]